MIILEEDGGRLIFASKDLEVVVRIYTQEMTYENNL